MSCFTNTHTHTHTHTYTQNNGLWFINHAIVFVHLTCLFDSAKNERERVLLGPKNGFKSFSPDSGQRKYSQKNLNFCIKYPGKNKTKQVSFKW